MDKKDPLFVGTLEKGMRIIDLFRTAHTPLGLSDIARRADLEKSAAQRLCHTLYKLGFLERDDDTRRYRPGMRMLEMAFAYLIQDRLVELAMPRLIEVARTFNTTVNLSVLDGVHIVYKTRIPHARQAYDTTLIGVRQPALNTAAGLVMLAFRPPEDLESVLARWQPAAITPHTTTDPERIRAQVAAARQDGYTITSNQLMLQELGVAAPVMGEAGVAVAAVSMPVYMPDWSVERVREELVSVVTETARSVSYACTAAKL
ncbi:IclR family transcriptional regulator [Caenispirillum bisanense]|uniref:IclR family transcriptional regulator n=1 Tax=Caenispirillum bisanense TaxID=414052 RepID=UPI0031D90314